MVVETHKGARALAALALVVCAGLANGCAHPNVATQSAKPSSWQPPAEIDALADYALFEGKEVSTRLLAQIECQEGFICLHPASKLELTIEPVKVIQGNPDIGIQTCETVRRGGARRDVVRIFRAQRNDEGEWELDCSS